MSLKMPNEFTSRPLSPKSHSGSLVYVSSQFDDDDKEYSILPSAFLNTADDKIPLSIAQDVELIDYFTFHIKSDNSAFGQLETYANYPQRVNKPSTISDDTLSSISEVPELGMVPRPQEFPSIPSRLTQTSGSIVESYEESSQIATSSLPLTQLSRIHVDNQFDRDIASWKLDVLRAKVSQNCRSKYDNTLLRGIGSWIEANKEDTVAKMFYYEDFRRTHYSRGCPMGEMQLSLQDSDVSLAESTHILNDRRGHSAPKIDIPHGLNFQANEILSDNDEASSSASSLYSSSTVLAAMEDIRYSLTSVSAEDSDIFSDNELADALDDSAVDALIAALLPDYELWKAEMFLEKSPQEARDGADNSTGAQNSNSSSFHDTSNSHGMSSKRKSPAFVRDSYYEPGNEHGNGDEDDDDDEDEDGARRPKRRKELGATGACVRLTTFVCPWFRRDPETFSRCGRKRLTTIGSIGQHMGRPGIHRVPIHCDSCGQKFKNGLEKKSHVFDHRRCQQDEANVSKILYGTVSDEMKSNIKTALRTRQKLEDLAKWNIIYKTLFPEVHSNDMPDAYIDHWVLVEESQILLYGGTARCEVIAKQHDTKTGSNSEPGHTELLMRALPRMAEVTCARKNEPHALPELPLVGSLGLLGSVMRPSVTAESLRMHNAPRSNQRDTANGISVQSQLTTATANESGTLEFTADANANPSAENIVVNNQLILRHDPHDLDFPARLPFMPYAFPAPALWPPAGNEIHAPSSSDMAKKESAEGAGDLASSPQEAYYQSQIGSAPWAARNTLPSGFNAGAHAEPWSSFNPSSQSPPGTVNPADLMLSPHLKKG